MNKLELLYELQHEIYVSLRPSGIHGIGVFAIRNIPKGSKHIFSKETGDWIRLSFEEVELLPEHSRLFIETYYLYDDTHYYIPGHGCKIMDMASYLNHSDIPNIISVDEGAFFEALRDIQPGEELLIHYGTVVTDGVGDY